MLKLIVDADACPTIYSIELLAQKYNIPITYVCDTSHNIKTEYGTVVIVDKGNDSADYKILSLANKNSIVITQDYALAGLCLTKNATVIHNNAFMITNENIDSLLNQRFQNQKARQAKQKIINPKKRTQQTNVDFKNILEKVIKDKLQIK